MTRPTREKVAQRFAAFATETLMSAGLSGIHVRGDSAKALECADGLLSLLPEGRSEQDQGGEVERLRADVFRPGVMRCAKCQFRLIRNVLYAQTGNIGVGTSETEPCPNGCGPLWPVTWKDECKEADKCWDQQVERAVKAEADLSAALLRNKALEAQLARVQPLLSDEDRMHPVGCSTWQSDAFVIGEEITALLSSAQGETKEGFDGLPELPCGEQPGASVGATAALAPKANTYRGWLIDLTPAGWMATSPNYDASYEGPEDGWVDNGEKVTASTRDDLHAEIDAWIAERAEC